MSASDIKQVTIGDNVYDVPHVPWCELEEILPLIGTVSANLKIRLLNKETLKSLGLIVYHGVKCGSPNLTYEEFKARPATVDEMATAMSIICQQAGLRLRSAADKETATGEATGE